MKKISVAIADDNLLTRKKIINQLKNYEDIELAFSVSNGEEIVRRYNETPTDVILMDIEMPVLDGIAATKKIKQSNSDCKIIMLTTFDDDEKIFNAILNGASGYLLKEESDEIIYKSIIDIMNGGAAMSPGIAFRTLAFIRSQKETGSAAEKILSTREIEILNELKNGLAYKEIAAKLFISEGTVRKHIENIYRKLQVNNKTNAINKAVENKWIS